MPPWGSILPFLGEDIIFLSFFLQFFLSFFICFIDCLTGFHTDDVVSPITIKKKRKADVTVTRTEDTADLEVPTTHSQRSSQTHPVAIEAERARLDRDHILTAMALETEDSPTAGLEGLLPPVLQIALLDDVHDIHIRAARRDQYQNQQHQHQH